MRSAPCFAATLLAALAANAAQAHSGEGSAYAEHQEQVKGSLEPGKLADLVVLTADIFNIPPADLDKARVYTTVFDGAVVYQQRAAQH